MAKLWRYDEANDKWIKVSEDDPLPVTLSEEDLVIKTGDIELGAVELKDATTTNRLIINNDGTITVKPTTAEITTLKSHATITETITGADIDASDKNNFLITYNLGAGSGGTPTLTITVQVKDSHGNYITDADYTSSALAAGGSGLIKGYLETYNTFRVICTLGGTGTFAASTIDVTTK